MLSFLKSQTNILHQFSEYVLKWSGNEIQIPNKLCRERTVLCSVSLSKTFETDTRKSTLIYVYKRMKTKKKFSSIQATSNAIIPLLAISPVLELMWGTSRALNLKTHCFPFEISKWPSRHQCNSDEKIAGPSNCSSHEISFSLYHCFPERSWRQALTHN